MKIDALNLVFLSLVGLFEYSHMRYEVERAADKAGEPSIEEMTKKAIEILQKNPKGYFLLVEGLFYSISRLSLTRVRVSFVCENCSRGRLS